jgi:hypothetical protein
VYTDEYFSELDLDKMGPICFELKEDMEPL